jgi:hypothetical protein
MMRKAPPFELLVPAVLGMIWALVALSIRYVVPGNLEMLVAGGRELGYFGPLIAFSAVSIPLLWLVSGVGLIAGQKWGWWLAGAHYMCGVIRFAQAYLHATGYRLVPQGGMTNIALRDLACIMIYCGLLAVLYSGRVRKWCRTEAIPQRRAFVATSVVVIGLMGSTSFVTYLLSRSAG